MIGIVFFLFKIENHNPTYLGNSYLSNSSNIMRPVLLASNLSNNLISTTLSK